MQCAFFNKSISCNCSYLCHLTVYFVFSMEAEGILDWQVLVAQGCRIEDQQQQLLMLNTICTAVQHTDVTTSCSGGTITICSPFITWLNKYSGNPAQCQWFVPQSSLYFSKQEGVSQCKVTQFINLLADKDLIWVTAVWFHGEVACLFICLIVVILSCF